MQYGAIRVIHSSMNSTFIYSATKIMCHESLAPNKQTEKKSQEEEEEEEEERPTSNTGEEWGCLGGSENGICPSHLRVSCVDITNQ